MVRKVMMVSELRKTLIDLYDEKEDQLPFHGWNHIQFVTQKAIEFARHLEADIFLVESASLTHDLNYIAEKNSDPDAGSELRKSILSKIGYRPGDIEIIERVINEAHIVNRHKRVISIEAQALSDADTLFKALPITPVIIEKKYLDENGIELLTLATKIVRDQKVLLDNGTLFYTELANQKYLRWARTNIELWMNVLECLEEEDIRSLL